MARKVLRLLYGKMFLAQLPGRKVSWRIFRIAKAQKESIRFALWYAAVILRVCLSKNRWQMIPALSAERGTQTATLLNLENQDSLHKLWAKATSYIFIYAVIGISPFVTELSHRKMCDIACVMLVDNIHCLRLSFGRGYDYRIRQQAALIVSCFTSQGSHRHVPPNSVLIAQMSWYADTVRYFSESDRVLQFPHHSYQRSNRAERLCVFLPASSAISLVLHSIPPAKAVKFAAICHLVCSDS